MCSLRCVDWCNLFAFFFAEERDRVKRMDGEQLYISDVRRTIGARMYQPFRKLRAVLFAEGQKKTEEKQKKWKRKKEERKRTCEDGELKPDCNAPLCGAIAAAVAAMPPVTPRIRVARNIFSR